MPVRQPTHARLYEKQASFRFQFCIQCMRSGFILSCATCLRVVTRGQWFYAVLWMASTYNCRWTGLLCHGLMRQHLWVEYYSPQPIWTGIGEVMMLHNGLHFMEDLLSRVRSESYTWLDQMWWWIIWVDSDMLISPFIFCSVLEGMYLAQWYLTSLITPSV